MSRLQHYCEENGCYFITTTTEGRKRIFADKSHSQILCNTIKNVTTREEARLLAFVIMPDHLHLVIIPAGDGGPSRVMREIKKGSARLINKSRGMSDKVWMDQYYDYMVRDERDLVEKINYIHNNPVKRGLVQEPEEYYFSSANPVFEPFLFKEW